MLQSTEFFAGIQYSVMQIKNNVMRIDIYIESSYGGGSCIFQPFLGMGQQIFKSQCRGGGGSCFPKQPLFQILQAKPPTPTLLFDHSLTISLLK